MTLAAAALTSMVLGAGTLGFLWPFGCASSDVAQAGYQEAERNGVIIASGKNGDTRGSIDGSNGSLILKGVDAVNGNFVLQESLKNGFPWYKNAEKQCTIEHDASESVSTARRLNTPLAPEWEVICEDKVLYRSFFDTASGPTGGWQAAPGVTEKVPSMELISGILVPEGSAEKLVHGAFIIHGLNHGRPSYQNADGCQIFYHNDKDTAQGEWHLMCWAECDHQWLLLYKVADDNKHHLPPLSGWEVASGEAPAPTFAVLNAMDLGEQKPQVPADNATQSVQ